MSSRGDELDVGRRKFLGAVSSGTTMAIAGCTGDDDTGDDVVDDIGTPSEDDDAGADDRSDDREEGDGEVVLSLLDGDHEEIEDGSELEEGEQGTIDWKIENTTNKELRYELTLERNGETQVLAEGSNIEPGQEYTPDQTLLYQDILSEVEEEGGYNLTLTTTDTEGQIIKEQTVEINAVVEQLDKYERNIRNIEEILDILPFKTTSSNSAEEAIRDTQSLEYSEEKVEEWEENVIPEVWGLSVADVSLMEDIASHSAFIEGINNFRWTPSDKEGYIINPGKIKAAARHGALRVLTYEDLERGDLDEFISAWGEKVENDYEDKEIYRMPNGHYTLIDYENDVFVWNQRKETEDLEKVVARLENDDLETAKGKIGWVESDLFKDELVVAARYNRDLEGKELPSGDVAPNHNDYRFSHILGHNPEEDTAYEKSVKRGDEFTSWEKLGSVERDPDDVVSSWTGR